LKRQDVSIASVPQIEGLTRKDFEELASAKPSMKKYLPDEVDWVRMDRTWLCNVLYTLDEEGV